MQHPISGLLAVLALAVFPMRSASADEPVNLALSAAATTSFVSGHESLEAVHDGFDPSSSEDHSHGAYGNWPKTGTQWVEYQWPKPVGTKKSDVYWWQDGRGIHLPTACRLLYWDGGKFAPVPEAKGLGIAPDQYNTTTHAEVITTRLRLEFDGQGTFSTGILEWKVYDSGKSPKFPPRKPGGDRVVVVSGKTYLTGEAKGHLSGPILWSKESGPGTVTFEQADALETTASFSDPGHYVLKLTADVPDVDPIASDTLQVEVVPPPPASHQLPVYTKSYKLDSPLWNPRAKALIVGWIPHCVAQLSDPNLPEGGIQNFIEAGNKNAGRPHKPHVGAPWANAYLLNTYESICVALQVDPQGDKDIAKAQAALRKTLEEWTPILLAAQEADGYLQTRFTLGSPREQGKTVPRWTYRGDHEGYVSGYFIEAAIAHYLLHGGADHRMLDAAKRLADCWDRNIGPAPKKTGSTATRRSNKRSSVSDACSMKPKETARATAISRWPSSCSTAAKEESPTTCPISRWSGNTRPWVMRCGRCTLIPRWRILPSKPAVRPITAPCGRFGRT